MGPPVFGTLVGLIFDLFWVWFYGRTQAPSVSDVDPKRHVTMTAFSVVFVGAHAVGLFSNSYIEAQEEVVRYLSTTMVFLYVSIRYHVRFSSIILFFSSFFFFLLCVL